MYRLFLGLWACAALGGCARPAAHGCAPTAHEAGDSAFVLSAGPAHMEVLLAGGRIGSFTFEGKEILTQPADHEMFGSTLWLSPQQEWNWPPSPALDNLAYHGVKDGNKVVLTSKPDPNTGYQVRKTISMHCDPAHAEIAYELVNTSTREKKVAAWEVTRVPGGGIAFFPGSIPPDYPPSDLEWVSVSEGLVWFCCNPILNQNGTKLFAEGTEGWIAYARKGLLFIKLFADIPADRRPPTQGEVEIFARGDGSYLELENHGPYTLLAPGQRLEYPVRWFVLPIPESVEVVSGNQELARLVRNFLSNFHPDSP